MDGLLSAAKNGKTPSRYAFCSGIEHFQQKCEAVLRWTMRPGKGLHFEPKVRSGFALDNAARKGLHFEPKVQSGFAFGTMLWGSAHVSGKDRRVLLLENEAERNWPSLADFG
ncbi:hypothetical protein [Brucella sp. BO3]|uniref:hypothetical protein n=1 Tax=Brucella sp. BO3 TaxID=2691913 RepID=UPI0015F6E979|nr:hypothetical protein [Brucella sp. BO3]